MQGTSFTVVGRRVKILCVKSGLSYNYVEGRREKKHEYAKWERTRTHTPQGFCANANRLVKAPPPKKNKTTKDH